MFCAYAEWDKTIRIESHGSLDNIVKRTQDWIASNPKRCPDENPKFLVVDVFAKDGGVVGQVFKDSYKIVNSNYKLDKIDVLKKYYDGEKYEIPFTHSGLSEELSSAIINKIGGNEKWVLSMKAIGSKRFYELFKSNGTKLIGKDNSNNLYYTLSYLESEFILDGTVVTEFSFKDYSEYKNLENCIDFVLQSFYDMEHISSGSIVALVADRIQEKFILVEADVRDLEYILL